MSERIKIGTHNGCFHCDEALACFLLKLLPRYKDAVVVRSREPEILDKCDIVVDVGGQYNPSKHRYDHHMKDFTETGSTVLKKPQYSFNIMLSSAGLIYCHFGHEIIKEIIPELADEHLDQIFIKVYQNFVEEIDAIDNGLPMCNGEPQYNIDTDLSSRIRRLNPTWNSVNVDVEERFKEAMNLTGSEFISTVENYSRVWLPAKQIVEEAIEKRFQIDPSGEIAEFPHSVPWIEHYFEIEKEKNIQPALKYVLFKEDNTHRVRAVPIEKNSFRLRIVFPEPWLGLRDSELSKVSGIDGMIFVHNTGFIGINKTRDGALKMAQKSLEMAESKA